MSREASGLRAWALQRLTAIYLGLYLLLLSAVLVSAPPGSSADWNVLLAGPWTSLATLLLIVSLLLHAWVGVRDILIDYVKPVGIKLPLLALVIGYLAVCGLWAAQIILSAGAA